MTKAKRMRGMTMVLACLLVLALAPAALADNYYGTIRNPNGGSFVNVRSWPSYDAEIMTQLGVGTSVEITGTTGTWYSVWVNGLVGYIHSNFVSTGGGGNGGSIYTNAVVRSGPLNVREAPTMRARIITQLPTNYRVYVVENMDTWSRIEYGTNTWGYVVSNFLTFDGQPSPTPNPPVDTPNANATIRTNNGGSLNLREWGSSSAPIMGAYPNGSRVRVLTQGASWCRVQVEYTYGYMSTAYLAMDGGGTPSPGTGYDAVVNNPGAGQMLNLREQPSTTSRSLGQYGNGTRLKVQGVGTDWLRVTVGGQSGYMQAKFVRITSAGATPHKTVTGGSGGWVNLRSGPGYDYGILRRVNNGSAATVTIPYPTWSYVLVRDGSSYQQGYILNSFLK